MVVGIIKDDFYLKHSSSWTGVWVEYCRDNKILHELIDWRGNGAIDQMMRCDAVLWHFSHYSRQEMEHARSILYSCKMAGCRVFPDFFDAWHFDDKIAQVYALAAIGAPTPRNFVFYDAESFLKWMEKYSFFPLVAKLKTGSGAYNVQFIKDPRAAKEFGRRMFKGEGFSATPNIMFKIKSNFQSSKNLSEIFRRAKRIPEFLYTLSKAKTLQREKEYVYLQEYIQNDGFDLKVVVVGDKLSFIGRNNRKSDFRASGGGDIFYERENVSKKLVETAFSVADKLGSQCIGFDFVIEKATGRPVILEMSYAFSHSALLSCGGYYDRNFDWHGKPLNAPKEILKNIIN